MDRNCSELAHKKGITNTKNCANKLIYHTNRNYLEILLTVFIHTVYLVAPDFVTLFYEYGRFSVVTSPYCNYGAENAVIQKTLKITVVRKFEDTNHAQSGQESFKMAQI